MPSPDQEEQFKQLNYATLLSIKNSSSAFLSADRPSDFCAVTVKQRGPQPCTKSYLKLQYFFSHLMRGKLKFSSTLRSKHLFPRLSQGTTATTCSASPPWTSSPVWTSSPSGRSVSIANPCSKVNSTWSFATIWINSSKPISVTSVSSVW